MLREQKHQNNTAAAENQQRKSATRLEKRCELLLSLPIGIQYLITYTRSILPGSGISE